MARPLTRPKIPLVDLKAQYVSLREEIWVALERVLESGRFILGEEVDYFEKEWAATCQASYAVGVASGTVALHLALSACGVGPGDEVVTVPFTFIATTEAISYTGAKISFVDIDLETYTMDPSKLRRAITRRTKAILPVHLFGHPANMDPILEVARRYRLTVIEDAAEAHLACYQQRPVGTIGDIGCFSFFPSKNLGAYGDAGMVVTNDPEIADRVRLLRNHGRREKYRHLTEGYNYRMDALQAAVLRVKSRFLEKWTQARRRLAKLYESRLRDLPVLLPEEMPWARHVYHCYVIRDKKRSALQAALRQQGIETGIHYPLPLHLQPAYRRLGLPRGSFPNSERMAKECLSLPMFPELTDSQVKRVSAVISHWHKKRNGYPREKGLP